METRVMNADGSTAAFDANWKSRKETHYNHWTPGTPRNQIQLAFRQHWTLFSEILKDTKVEKCLEVGCGRGSLSSYFAAAGAKCTLLDYSTSVLEVAKEIFRRNGHRAEFVCGDALALPFAEGTFDVVFSIGLLEHFENIEKLLKEQHKILRKGGFFLGYVVPEKPDNIQRSFRWINRLLAMFARVFGITKKTAKKEEIYRSDFGSERYLKVLEEMPVKDLRAFGVYPLPMISHSPDFPFSLLPKPLELALTGTFMLVLKIRRMLFGRHPWICDESVGQAFLIVYEKA